MSYDRVGLTIETSSWGREFQTGINHRHGYYSSVQIIIVHIGIYIYSVSPKLYDICVQLNSLIRYYNNNNKSSFNSKP